MHVNAVIHKTEPPMRERLRNVSMDGKERRGT